MYCQFKSPTKYVDKHVIYEEKEIEKFLLIFVHTSYENIFINCLN